MKRAGWLICAGLISGGLAACDDDAQSDGAQAADAGALDAALDAEISADAALDAEVADAEVIPDGAPLVIEAPQANVYLNDPVTDEGALTQITLPAVISEDGALTSPWVEVFNCLNEPGGVEANPFGNVTVTLCHEVQVARPDAEGHYLHLTPPADDADPNDRFAELMMYYHVNVAHDYFSGVHGFEGLDFPLPALVNVQFQVDPPSLASVIGAEADEDGWVPFSNAAFFPRESWEAFADQFGLPPRDTDTIIFFQGDKDFAYDGRVIYHEYTHAVVGTARLQVPAVPDQYGLANDPPSMNEGIADYFAASVADDPTIGAYVGVEGLALRDLSEFRGCPEDTLDEVHAHGQLIGSTLWSIRSEIGAAVADEIVFRALEQFTLSTTHEEAAALLLAEAAAFEDEVLAKVTAALEAHGFGGCVRSLPFATFNAAGSRDRLPHIVEGQATTGLPGFEAVGVPAYKQFHVDVPEGAAAVRLTWSMRAGGLLPGLGGGTVQPLDLALRDGEPVRLSYENGVQAEYDARITAPLDGQTQQITLGGGCLPEAGGRIYTLFFNGADDAMQILTMDIEILDAVEGGESVVTCQE